MNPIAVILKKDQLDPGSFGTREKNIAYATLAAASVPVLFLPLFSLLVRRGVLRLTALLLLCLLLLALAIRYRFGWILWIDDRLAPYYPDR